MPWGQTESDSARPAPSGAAPAATERSSAVGVSVSEAARRTGLSRSRLYQLIRSGRVRTVPSSSVTLLSEADVAGLAARAGALIAALADLGGSATDEEILEHAERARVGIAPQALRHLARAAGVITHAGPNGRWRFTLPRLQALDEQPPASTVQRRPR